MHKARVYQRSKAERARLRQNVTDYLICHPCVDCGETDVRVLEFDHRADEMKKDSIARMIAHTTWSVIEAEIAKCDVRCANCHRRRTHERAGFWRQQVHAKLESEHSARSAERLRKLFARPS